jgi:hypothetical protein
MRVPLFGPPHVLLVGPSVFEGLIGICPDAWLVV